MLMPGANLVVLLVVQCHIKDLQGNANEQAASSQQGVKNSSIGSIVSIHSLS